MSSPFSEPGTDQTVITSLTVNDPEAALAFYEKAFGAKIGEVARMSDNTIMHANFQIGNTAFYLSGEFSPMQAVSPLTLGGAPACLCIRSEDCDAVFERAVAAGAEVLDPIQDRFWGERMGLLRDPSGYRWSISKTVETVTMADIERRLAEIGTPPQ